jgi:metal-responsive CopG/Arc/MetJ family transcriptional regulator
MSQVLIHFDEATLKAIDRIAPVARRKRADFIRQAVKDAIFRHETERMREAYRLQPDSPEGSETWDLPEDWKE